MKACGSVGQPTASHKLFSTLDVVSDQLQAPASLIMGNSLGDLRVGLDPAEKRKTFCTCQESKSDYSVSDP
jgi:hypothetical protein